MKVEWTAAGAVVPAEAPEHWHRGTSASEALRSLGPDQLRYSHPRSAATKHVGEVFLKTRGRRSIQISLSPVPKIAVACTLHNSLRAREGDVRTKAFGHEEVSAADQ
jgi:hypothetical protein